MENILLYRDILMYLKQLNILYNKYLKKFELKKVKLNNGDII